SSSTAWLVIAAVTTVPPTSIFTCAVVAPLVTSVTLPLSRLRALMRMGASPNVIQAAGGPSGACLDAFTSTRKRLDVFALARKRCIEPGITPGGQAHERTSKERHTPLHACRDRRRRTRLWRRDCARARGGPGRPGLRGGQPEER